MQNKNNGYSLIELVVVIIILGILFMISTHPRNKEVAEIAAITAAEDFLASDLKICRTEALQTQLLQKVVFINNSTDYTFYEKSPTLNAWVLKRYSYILPQWVKIISTTLVDNQIVFDINGKPYEDPQADLPDSSLDIPLTVSRNINLRTNEGTVGNVSISPETGYVY
jgi:prepilin-type N-terminal cleavage/methylation domain-containing protein